MGIQVVEPEDVGEPGHRRVLQEDIAESKVGGEVEEGVETCVDSSASDSASEGGSYRSVAVEYLSHGGQVRVERVELGVEALPKSATDVRESVDAQTVETSLFRPPDGVLSQVAGDGRILLVEIGKSIGEPSLSHIDLVAPGRVGIGERSKVSMRERVIFKRAVEPRGIRTVANPWVVWADVVWNGVEDELHVTSM